MKMKKLTKIKVNYLNEIFNETQPKSIVQLAKTANMTRHNVSDLLFNHDTDLFLKVNGHIDMKRPSLQTVVKNLDKIELPLLVFTAENIKRIKMIEMLKEGETNKTKIAKELNMTRQGLYNWLEVIKKMYMEASDV